MKHSRARTAVLLVSLVYAVPVSAQDQIVVDVSGTIADVARRPLGINLNFLLDDDGNRPGAIATLAQALKRAGVKYLRYPGGEKSDGYLWSVPPYSASIPTLARWATGDWPENAEWPSYDRSLVSADGRTFKTDVLSFDEFMAICREIDCIPTVVICYDSMYKPAQPGGAAPTRAELLETAREWVRYANVRRGYNVQYWELGNETWQSHYNGGASARAYAHDLVEFSRAMKSVDPTIKIGANGHSAGWWQVVLPAAGSSIDFLAVHNYPAYGWGSYTHYRDHQLPLMDVVATARSAISAFTSPADRDRLEIAVTESGPADWSGSWPHRNDLGHALVLFDLFGQHLVDPDVAFTQLWTTRWSGNDSASVPRLFDAFDRNNHLQASGQVLGIWGHFLKGSMVATTSTNMIRTYATYSASDGTLTVFLINKDTRSRETSIRIDGLSSSLAVERWVFTGNGPGDVYPTWTRNHEELAQNGNRFTTRLDPVSVTVLDIRALSTPVRTVPGTIEAEDFDAFWDSTPENYGGQYRSTAVDIESSVDNAGGYNVGWIAPGEWLEYAIQVPTGGTYGITARVASPAAGATLQIMIDGASVGTLNIPNTGGWQRWQTIGLTGMLLGAGAHQLRVFTPTGWFNLNAITIIAGAGLPPPAPARDVEVVIWPGHQPRITGSGWRAQSDATAAGGMSIVNPNFDVPKIATAADTPTSYVDLTFTADGQTAYRLWMRAKAASNHWANDSVLVQFSDTIDNAGRPIFRIGTTSSTWVSLEEMIGQGEHEWGWQDNGYGTPAARGPEIRFATTGTHTIRLQQREDGITIDQIVLSAVKYFSTPPGAQRDDLTILTEQR